MLGGKRSFFTGPLEKYRWRALLPQNVSADERMRISSREGDRSDRAKQSICLRFSAIFFETRSSSSADGRILTLFLNEVNGFVYSHSEELGNAFEYLLKTMGIQAENGQFRTPRHIIDFMVACLAPQPSDRILDPACGTGGFLVSCYKHILAQHTSPGSTIAGDKLTHDQRQKVYSNLTGYDVTDLMVKLSKVNLFLHGFPGTVFVAFYLSERYLSGKSISALRQISCAIDRRKDVFDLKQSFPKDRKAA